MNNHKLKGDVTELECILAFTKLGYQISIPFSEDCRYDFIADVNGKLLRIQCKTCKEIYDNGTTSAITFKTVRQSGSMSKRVYRKKYTSDEIDYFATFYNGECYIVPVEECSNMKTLRFLTPKNKQIDNINFAKDYLLKEVLKKYNIDE